MKINITITVDVEPSEIIAFMDHGKHPVEPEAPPVPSVRARVADCQKNRSGDYWKARIGDEASITPAGPEQVHAHFEGDAVPLYNVDLDRFTPIES
jgi:hypothetical protein